MTNSERSKVVYRNITYNEETGTYFIYFRSKHDSVLIQDFFIENYDYGKCSFNGTDKQGNYIVRVHRIGKAKQKPFALILCKNQSLRDYVRFLLDYIRFHRASNTLKYKIEVKA